MSEHHDPEWTYGRLLDRLRDEQVIDETQLSGALDHLEHEPAPIPWYIHAISGLGGFLAGALLLSFMACTGVISSGVGNIAVGLVLVVVTLGVRRLMDDQSSLFQQATLSINLLGQGLVLSGVGMLSDEPAAVATFYLFFAPLVYWLDRDMALRFVVSAGWFWALNWIVAGELRSTYVNHVLYGLVVGVVSFILSDRGLPHRINRELRPFAYAGVKTLIAFSMAATLTPRELMLSELVTRVITVVPLGILLGVAVLEADDESKMPATWSAGAAVILGVVSNTGIITSILMLVIGFWRARRPLVVVGALTLVGFVIHYYYDLETTLLIKSGVLLGSGTALLLIRWLLMRQPWMKQLLAQPTKEEAWS